MIIHYDSEAAAVEHLTSNGWHQIANGSWVSRDGSCSAAITPAFGSKVRVCYQEIETA